MEEPCGFDIWVKIDKELRQDAISDIAQWRGVLSGLELRILVNKAIISDEPILIKEGIDWHEVEKFKLQLPGWITKILVYQQGLSPADLECRYCTMHGYNYGGCLGCHVCNRFYR